MQGLGLLYQNIYKSDLLNEVLNIFLDQEAAKISKTKFGGGKKLPTLQPFNL